MPVSSEMSHKNAAGKVGPATSSHSHAAGPTAVLSVRQSMAIIVGIVIGAGIFKAPSMVAAMTGSPDWMFGAWLLGGVVSLIGALCYAELATSYAHPGGDYHFLQRAFGRNVSLMFGWARFTVITTGSIALLAFVFGDYMSSVLAVPGLNQAASSAIWAAAAVVLLTLLNLRGIGFGVGAQVGMTLLVIAGLLMIVVAALVISPDGAASVQAEAAARSASPPAAAAFGLAMVFVLLTYGGWNEAAYISAELRNPKRNLPLALMLSIGLITLLYLCVNWAYWHGLGIQGMASSNAVAADLLGKAFGTVGQALIALMVGVAALTSINATLIVGARTGYALGRDWTPLRKLGQWHAGRAVPSAALQLQGAAALVLIAIGWATGGGFVSMVEFTAPVFWVFFLLSGLSLFVLRWREPDLQRPYRVPLYPLLPILFCLVCGYMLWSSLSYVSSQELGGINAAWISIGVLAAGALPVWWIRKESALPETPPHVALSPTELK